MSTHPKRMLRALQDCLALPPKADLVRAVNRIDVLLRFALSGSPVLLTSVALILHMTGMNHILCGFQHEIRQLLVFTNPMQNELDAGTAVFI